MPTRRKFISKLVAGTGSAIFLLNESAYGNIKESLKKIADLSSHSAAGNEDFWLSIQSAFEVDRTLINLNNGGVSPSPKTVNDALKRHIDYSNQAPSFYMWQHLEPNIESVRQKLADTFGCDKEEMAITRNASESLEILQFGIDLKPGDEILTTDQDYPRMLTTWDQRMRRYGIKVKKISFPVPLKDNSVFLERIEDAITERTKLIMVSHVVFMTGQILPVKEVCRIAHSRGIDVICDGAHSFNHFPFTLSDLECDYFGTSLHKWTYSPIGTGFLYVRKDKIKDVWPLMAAEEKQQNDIRKFEEIGTHPAANHNAIAEALAFNQLIGLERKAARLRFLNKRWIDRLKEFENVRFMCDTDNIENWCGIMTFGVNGADHKKLTDYLMNQHNIFTVPIEHPQFSGIRVTPNVYTMLSEIDYFSEIMEKILSGSLEKFKKG